MDRPPPSGLRGHTAAEADSGHIPGRKSRQEPPDAPIGVIDLPDDFCTDEAEQGDLLVTAIAAVILLVVAIAAAVLIGALS